MSYSAPTEKRAFIWLFVVLLIAGLYVIHNFLNVVLISIVIAIVFYPFHQKYLKWTRQRPSLSAFLSVLSVVILLMIPSSVLLTIMTAQLAGVIHNIPQGTSGGGVSGWLAHWQGYFQILLDKIEVFFGIKLDLGALFWEAFQKIGTYFAQYSPAVLAKAGSVFLDSFIMLILLFYLFRDGALLFQKLLRISPIKDQHEISLAREIKSTIYGVFYGSFLTGLIQAILATVGFYIAGIPAPLLWGATTFFVSFIPLIGTAGVIIPLVIYLLLQGSYGYATFLAIYGAVIIGSSDNVLKPMLIRSNIHQALLFLSLFGGFAVFGPLGLLLGPIVMAMLTATMRIYEGEYMETRRKKAES
jgi:predicted PurR-regulated permease PerM